MPTAKPTNQPAVLAALSASRLSTYPAVTDWHLGDALQLYGWNARVSAALMLPAHFAEVTTRNAVDEALTAVYGPSWPWDPSLERSVPNPPAAYNPRKDLQLTRIRHATTGKVIAEFKFVFWQKMFHRPPRHARLESPDPRAVPQRGRDRAGGVEGPNLR